MDFATLIGQLGPDARDAVSQFYFEDGGGRNYGDDFSINPNNSVPAPSPATNTANGGAAPIVGGLPSGNKGLFGILGGAGSSAAGQPGFYFGEDGVPTYGDTAADVTPVIGIQSGGDGIMGILKSEGYNDTYNYQNIDPSAYLDDKKEGASRLFADIIRAQTQDYLTRFAPIEDYLASTITRTGTTFLEGDMNRTREAIMDGAQSARGQYTRQFERYGVAGRQLDNTNATTSALVGGMNDTRDRDVDRKIALLGGGLGSIAQKARAQQGAG